MQASPKARPTGITILAILAAIGGILGLLGSLAVIGVGSVLATAGYGGLYTLIGFGVLAISVAELVFAFGAWGLRPWAWMLGIALFIANIVLNLLWITQGASIGNLVVTVVISLAILYYLDTPAIRTAFGQKAESFYGKMMKK